jgi:hypothetical protein
MLRPVLILLTQMADGLTFALVVSKLGISGELNPIIVSIYGMGGLAGILTLKASGAVIAALIVAITRTRLWVFVAWFGIFGAASNLLAFWS